MIPFSVDPMLTCEYRVAHQKVPRETLKSDRLPRIIVITDDIAVGELGWVLTVLQFIRCKKKMKDFKYIHTMAMAAPDK